MENYEPHPDPSFKNDILIHAWTNKVLSRDNVQYYVRDGPNHWIKTEVFIEKKLTLEQYIKRYCTYAEIDGKRWPIYTNTYVGKLKKDLDKFCESHPNFEGIDVYVDQEHVLDANGVQYWNRIDGKLMKEKKLYVGDNLSREYYIKRYCKYLVDGRCVYVGPSFIDSFKIGLKGLVCRV